MLTDTLYRIGEMASFSKKKVAVNLYVFYQSNTFKATLRIKQYFV